EAMRCRFGTTNSKRHAVGKRLTMRCRFATILQVPEEIASQLHNPEYSNETELEYRLAWARTYLKNYGILERSGRGVWAIKADKQSVERVDPLEVNRFVHALSRPKPNG